MSHRPSHADTLVRNVHLVSFDSDSTVISDGAIAIVDGVIVDRGSTAELSARWTAGRTINGGGKIAIPGLTDAHIHTAQTMMRGLLSTLQKTRNLRVPTWREYLVPFEAALSPEDVELSGKLAYSSMLLTGTTSFFEAGGPHPDRMASAAQASGIRGIVSLSTMDGGDRIPGSMTMSTEQALARNIEVVESLPTASDGSNRVTGGMSLRQIVTCTSELVTSIHAEARMRGVKVHTHLVEGTYEIDYSLEKFGKRPVEYLVDLGVFTDTLHCAHSVLASMDDVDTFRRHGASACHCAKGNYSIGAAPALKMWRRGVAIGLGTDGVANLGTLDMFRVAMLTRIGQQLVESTPVHNRNGVGAEEPLGMAIVGGSRSMGLSAHTGSLEIGKRADIVLIGMDSPDAAGYASPEAFLYECASGRDVTTVIVDGELVVDGGELLTVDVAEIRSDATARQRVLMDAIA
ncbi:MAG TPA: amidohydrolase family protein [Glaciihabitans sp.]|jgi:5-methylthioadenosine/S-adenosylhomocysteine deaminase|nr:amidohydrolase family protein [Glaciihabitans sp.]